MEKVQPKVSITMLTYGHEKYIRQAIDSVLMQKVNFTYELIIAEDCSPDNTRAILYEYKKKFPDKIKLATAISEIALRRRGVRGSNPSFLLFSTHICPSPTMSLLLLRKHCSISEKRPQ